MADQSYDGFISYSHAADDLLAPRLQAGLQRFAKPWWKRRAVRIFRDESSLSANPHLWSSITEALDTSGWFVLLLSPDAAASEWVNQEIAYWIQNRDPKKILPVVTGGSFGWVDGEIAGDAVPDALRGVFTEEPRWVDLRWARDEDQLDLKNPRFADAVADIASAIRGVPKDDLASEEVRQHRRTVRTAWAAGGLVTVLAIAAVGFGITSARNANEAERQAELAAEQADLAEANADEARRSSLIARSRELAAAAINLLDEDPALSLLLALESVDLIEESDAPVESMVALREATDSIRVLRRFEPATDETPHDSALSPDGQVLVWLSSVTVSATAYDTSTFEELWSYQQTGSNDFADTVYFSSDGTEVVFSVADVSTQGFAEPRDDVSPDGRWARIIVLDAETGDLRREFEMPPETCPGVLIGPQSSRGLWPVLRSDSAVCIEEGEGWRVDLVDLATLDPVGSLDAYAPASMSWSADGTRLSVSSFFGEGAQVFEVESGELLMEVPLRWFGTLSPDGHMLAVSNLESFASTVELYDVESGQRTDTLIGLDDPAFVLTYSNDGRRLIAASRSEVVSWLTINGYVEFEVPALEAVVAAQFDERTQRLYHLSLSSVTVLDVSSPTSGGIGLVQSNGMLEVGSRGAVSLEDQIAVFDTATGGLEHERLQTVSNFAVLADGRVVVEIAEDTPDGLAVGPVVAWEPDSGMTTPIVGCQVLRGDISGPETPCLDDGTFFNLERIAYDETTDTLALAAREGRVLLYEGSTLEFEREIPVEASGGFSEIGDGWIAVSSNPPSTISSNERVTVFRLLDLGVVFETTSFREETDPTGRLIAVNDRPGGFTVYEALSGDVVASASGTDARLTGFAFSDDSTKLATTGVDGFVRIWDLATETEVHRLPVGNPSDALWVSDDELLVGTVTGEWRVIALSPEDAIAAARNALYRGFTPEECSTYRIDPCPKLEEVQGG